MKKYLDLGNFLVIIITVVLFIIALFVKGFTHDLLLEAGILLVSVKIILMSYKNSIANQSLLRKLDEMKQLMDEMKNRPSS